MRYVTRALAILLFCAAPALLAQSTEMKLSEDEKTILNLTNAARKQYQLPPLVVNATLMKCARDHNANMARQNKLAHTLDDKSPFDRLRAAAYSFRSAGENIASGDVPMSAKEAFESWMKSEGHRQNILSSGFVEIGIAAGRAGDQRFFTQVFGTQQK
jgi:uncharacterized protein YkwD